MSSSLILYQNDKVYLSGDSAVCSLVDGKWKRVFNNGEKARICNNCLIFSCGNMDLCNWIFEMLKYVANKSPEYIGGYISTILKGTQGIQLNDVEFVIAGIQEESIMVYSVSSRDNLDLVPHPPSANGISILTSGFCNAELNNYVVQHFNSDIPLLYREAYNYIKNERIGGNVDLFYLDIYSKHADKIKTFKLDENEMRGVVNNNCHYVLAENLVGNVILGNELGIYSSDNSRSLQFDNFGLRLNAIEQENGIYSHIFEISKTDLEGNTKVQMYVDDQGNIVLASDQIIQMHDKLDTVEAEIGNFDKMYVKEATIEKLLAEYIKAEDIEAFNAEFKKLIASEAEFEQLEANNATIYGLLTAAKADIDTLNANKVSVNDLDAYKITVNNLLADKANIADLEADYIKADAIDAKYAKITQLDATNANVSNLTADVANINTLVAGKADITDLQAETARIDTLYADVANVNTLLADKITADEVDAKIVNANKVITDDIQANTAEINQIKADYVKTSVFDAEVGRIDTAIIGKADIADLNAANANIGTLQGQYANIETILSGSIGTGTLQTIHLTAQNFVADSGVIKEAMIGDLSAGKITSGTINTDNVNIQSTDGSMRLTGSLQQFYDENNVCRIQMGKDAQGKFSFTIFDENGTGVLIDSKGVHSDAIADGLIVDKHVAAGAGIKGSKLDIDSVVAEINDNSTTTLKSNKIWIDEENQSLGASFNAIKTTVGKTVANIIPYYMLGESEITAPTIGWQTTPPTNGGPYLWRKDKKVLSDGTEDWGDPYLVRLGDNVSVIISSSEGTVFKGTGVTTTTLTCTVYKGGKVATPSSYQWKKKNGTNWDSVGATQSIQVAVSSINGISNYKCEVDI